MPSVSQPELFDPDSLARRLTALGLKGVTRIECHDNRAVMVSVNGHGVLRIHRGFAYAGDAVLEAVVAFVNPQTRRQRRLRARDTILTFPVDGYVPARRRRLRRRRSEPGDRLLVRRLTAMHREFNDRYFDGSLSAISFRISHRMSCRLGEVSLDPATNAPLEIALSRQHIERDGWREAEHTLLHEMIHQWQAERGLPVDHGPLFRRKAREVGVVPRARRRVNQPDS